MVRTILGLGLLASLPACVATGRLPQPAAAAPVLDPIRFFAGETRGEGVMKIAARKRQTVEVTSRGQLGADGAIRLEQMVRVAGKPPTRRQWQLLRGGDGRYSGTLTDAAGPVTGTMIGGRLHLRFAMKGGLRAEQWLALQADGRTLQNVMIVRKFGLPVARLDETITKSGE
jgi:hypothetical protein